MSIHNDLILKSLSSPGGLRGRDRWACRHLQLRRRVESELHHLHSNKVLVLQAADGPGGHPARPGVGHLLRHPLLHPHLGRGALREELPNRDPLRQSSLLHLCAHLLRPSVRSHGEVLQQRAGRHHQGGVGTGRRKRARGIGWDGGNQCPKQGDKSHDIIKRAK